MLETFEKKPMIWWKHIDYVFFIWEHGEESLKAFMDQGNMFQPTIIFTAEYSKGEVNFLDLNIKLFNRYLSVFRSNFFPSLSPQKKEYLIVKL